MASYFLRMAKRKNSGEIVHIIEDELISASSAAEAVEKANAHNVAAYDDSDVAWLMEVGSNNVLWVRTIGDKPRA